MAQAIAYYWVSIRAQGRSALGLDAQREAVARFAEGQGIVLLAEFLETESGKGADALANRSLWYLERNEIPPLNICGRPHVHHQPKADYRAAEVASEPVTHEESWKAVPNGVLIAVDPHFKLHF